MRATLAAAAQSPLVWVLAFVVVQRLGELVLLLGGNGVVNEFFTRLPSATDTEYAPEELAGYAARMAQMSPPPSDLLRQRFGSPRWADRVIALRYFERKGTQSDLPQMQALTNDTATCTGPGWPAGHTVGKVATAAIASAKERLSEGASAGSPAQSAH